jgi:hypothetical protein
MNCFMGVASVPSPLARPFQGGRFRWRRAPQQTRASPILTSSKLFPSDPIALAMRGTPFMSTEWVVLLFAYACDTLSRPEGIIDHTVDDRPRDVERWDNESAERAAAGTESGTA